MPIDSNLLERLLHEEEGAALDFKRDQYAFEGAGNKAKSELLKDILAFANSWRRTTAYVLIGVNEVKGGRSDIVGVEKHLDDAKLHQFVNSKTQRPVEFSYLPFRTDEGGDIGVIEIPVQERPIYLRKEFGGLHANTVYKRDGSSTAVATPDELARMGEMRVSGSTPQFVLAWADLNSRKVLPSPCSVQSLFLQPLLSERLVAESQTTISDIISAVPRLDYRNENYSQEVILYKFEKALFKPLGFHLRNQSAVVGKRIRFVGALTKGDGIHVLNWAARKKRPQRSGLFIPSIVPLAAQLQSSPDPCVREHEERWEITIDFGDVRPQDEVWTTSPLLVGSNNSGTTKLEGELRGDNLPEPISCVLDIGFEVEQRPMLISDVRKYLDAS